MTVIDRDVEAIEMDCRIGNTGSAKCLTVSGRMKLSVLPLSNRQLTVWMFTWMSIIDQASW